MVNYPMLERYVQSKLQTNNNGHGYDHAYRVAQNVRTIATEVECNLDICLISAYVHDLIDRKVVDDVFLAATELELFLTESLGLDSTATSHIMQICNTISYSKNLKLESVEAKVVQDADRLDALGAVGIARTIAYSSAVNRPIYIADDKTDDTAIGHFHTKLYKLVDSLNFDISKIIGSQKMEIMYAFEQAMINENR